MMYFISLHEEGDVTITVVTLRTKISESAVKTRNKGKDKQQNQRKINHF